MNICTYLETSSALLLKNGNGKQKITENFKLTFYSQKPIFENRNVYETIRKNMADPVRPQIIQYGACALHNGYLKLQTQTHNMLYIFIFSPHQQSLLVETHFYVISALANFLGNKQKNLLAKLFPVGVTRHLRTATHSRNV
jgi:hypothetical protein